MSLKNRMFRTNMLSLFLALFSMLIVVVLVGILFAHVLEEYFASSGKADHVIEMGKLLAKTNTREAVLFGAAFLVIAIEAVSILLTVSSFFARRMNQMVEQPMELLMEAAKRIQAGELTTKISYQGEEEFECLCDTFNVMQECILTEKKQREGYEQARTDMVTGISHDLRTPLTAIQGYIKGVLDGVADTEEKREWYLQTAYEATEEMNVLLQKLFDFSRLESGQMPFHMVNVDLAEYTASYVAQKEAVWKQDEVIFNLATKEVTAEVAVDIEQLQRIFDNLLENSIKYAQIQPVEITAAVRIEKEAVVVEWKDNGSGVPQEKLFHIFERFYRCDESRSRKGSGIGLYIVKYIMERHRGTVNAVNDGGLKVQLYFPKASQDVTNCFEAGGSR